LPFTIKAKLKQKRARSKKRPLFFKEEGMKKIGLLLVCIAGIFSLGFGMKHIGITAITDHPALDAIRQGIIDGLVNRGFQLGVDIEVEFQSAQGNMNTAVSIANYFRTGGFDIVVAITTPSAQACANAIKNIPVVFSAATDPVAASLIPALGINPGNVVGVSDMTPVKTQIQLIRLIVPNIKTIGVIFNPGETNSVILTEHAQTACDELGIELVEVVGTTTSEMITTLSSMISQLDAIYIGNDNTAASCIESLNRVAQANDVPIICADISMSRTGGVVGYGFDYYGFGVDTASMVSELLNGKRTDEIASRLVSPDYLQLLIHLDRAKEINLQIPDSLKNRATFLIENGIETQTK
jgi:putative ABC transport system substrate-binding protein